MTYNEYTKAFDALKEKSKEKGLEPSKSFKNITDLYEYGGVELIEENGTVVCALNSNAVGEPTAYSTDYAQVHVKRLGNIFIGIHDKDVINYFIQENEEQIALLLEAEKEFYQDAQA